MQKSDLRQRAIVWLLVGTTLANETKYDAVYGSKSISELSLRSDSSVFGILIES
jgi:hypothetical protein